MKRCRECAHKVSEAAVFCPQCGAPRPARESFDGWGYEYKSKARILGMPLLHIAFKYRPNHLPVVARGVISIGQFGAGIINISQFGIGVISISQASVGIFVLAQLAVAYSCIAQMALYVDKGYGQVVYKVADILAKT